MLTEAYQAVEVMIDAHDEQMTPTLQLDGVELIKMLCFIWEYLKAVC